MRAAAIFVLAVLAGLLLHAAPARADDRLVLIASSANPATELSSSDVHKLFLGLTVEIENHRLRPIRNDADPQMRRIFYQHVVSMSESVYDRRMLALTLQQGRGALPVVSSTAEAIRALVEDANAVSFAWAGEVEHDARVKILRVLWHK